MPVSEGCHWARRVATRHRVAHVLGYPRHGPKGADDDQGRLGLVHHAQGAVVEDGRREYGVVAHAVRSVPDLGHVGLARHHLFAEALARVPVAEHVVESVCRSECLWADKSSYFHSEQRTPEYGTK